MKMADEREIDHPSKKLKLDTGESDLMSHHSAEGNAKSYSTLQLGEEETSETRNGEGGHTDEEKAEDEGQTDDDFQDFSSEETGSPSSSSDMSDVSDMSGFSEEAWKPMAGPMSWVQKQMVSGRNPRDILSRLVPDAGIPDDIENLMLWKIILNIVSEPPTRKKLPHINTMADVVNLLKTCTNIMVLTGAGVSVSCGIPDFRSRNGIYARLAVDFPDLPDPQAMFDINYFRKDPRPFFKFAKEIYPGQFEPSKSHKFIKLLESHNKLLRNYTQNIDTLEQVAGIRNIIQCHGSFATAMCMTCGYKVDAEAIREDIFNQVIPKCPKCPPDSQMPVIKPEIVFFGESLPEQFHYQMAQDKNVCDLLIVIGSSLKVRPVALIPNSLPANVPQILINKEPLRHLNFDVELLGDCDEIVSELCKQMGPEWESLVDQSCCQHEITRAGMTTPPCSQNIQPSSETASKGIDMSLSEQNNSFNEGGRNSESTNLPVAMETESKIQTSCQNCSDNKEHIYGTHKVSHNNELSHISACSCSVSCDTTDKTCETTASDSQNTVKCFYLAPSSFSSSSQACQDKLISDVAHNSGSDNSHGENNVSEPKDENYGEKHENGANDDKHLENSELSLKDVDRERCDVDGEIPDERNDNHSGQKEQHDQAITRELWLSQHRKSIASRLQADQYLFLPPNRYVFHGAEVYSDNEDDDDKDDDDDDDDDDQSSSSDSSFSPCSHRERNEAVEPKASSFDSGDVQHVHNSSENVTSSTSHFPENVVSNGDDLHKCEEDRDQYSQDFNQNSDYLDMPESKTDKTFLSDFNSDDLIQTFPDMHSEKKQNGVHSFFDIQENSF
ncbi:hypothetical protein ACJMK2_034526 [Sinanodonta woodiana]|uniref:protein acetyllysine N-acetyltransferase n=1 Tax=Sinanodonta woodiana TaxID=1069815 RepID=A0ABD3WRW6_SINWO